MLSSIGTLGTAARALGVSLRSAGQLDRHLALEDSLAIQLGNGTLSLRRSGQSDKGISNGTRGTGIGGDCSGLATEDKRVRDGR